jgi:hypothetical protein
LPLPPVTSFIIWGPNPEFSSFFEGFSSFGGRNFHHFWRIFHHS